MLLLHIGAFQLGLQDQGTTAWHRLTPQTRVLIALLMVIATVLTPQGHWGTWATYAGSIAGLIGLSQTRLVLLIQRVAVESVFVGVVLLGTLFHPGGTVFWQWGGLQISTTGLTLLGSISCKVLLCLSMLNLLVLTTAQPELLQALTVLKLPPLLVAILASMTRYLSVLIDELTSMHRAALSRNLQGRSHWQRFAVGNMIGSLFIRTYERGDRIHQAMLARGYTGTLQVRQLPQLQRVDRLALLVTVLVILLGQLVGWR